MRCASRRPNDDVDTDCHEVPAVAPCRELPGTDRPTWSTWREAVRVVSYPHLRRTVTIALIVGTVLFAINQLDVVVRGDATTIVWAKVAITYLVPFAVSNAGILIASRANRPPSAR
jgi:hypothetical protein